MGGLGKPGIILHALDNEFGGEPLGGTLGGLAQRLEQFVADQHGNVVGLEAKQVGSLLRIDASRQSPDTEIISSLKFDHLLFPPIDELCVRTAFWSKMFNFWRCFN